MHDVMPARAQLSRLFSSAPSSGLQALTVRIGFLWRAIWWTQKSEQAGAEGALHAGEAFDRKPRRGIHRVGRISFYSGAVYSGPASFVRSFVHIAGGDERKGRVQHCIIGKLEEIYIVCQ